MVAKSPDYIVAECGCPKWSTSGRTIEDFATLKRPIVVGDKSKRLLPLRETLADYNARVLASKLDAWEASQRLAAQRESSASKSERQPSTWQRSQDPAAVKHWKGQRNEAIKQQQHHFQFSTHMTSKPNTLDRRRHVRATTATLDSDLDVF